MRQLGPLAQHFRLLIGRNIVLSEWGLPLISFLDYIDESLALRICRSVRLPNRVSDTLVPNRQYCSLVFFVKLIRLRSRGFLLRIVHHWHSLRSLVPVQICRECPVFRETAIRWVVTDLRLVVGESALVLYEHKLFRWAFWEAIVLASPVIAHLLACLNILVVIGPNFLFFSLSNYIKLRLLRTLWNPTKGSPISHNQRLAHPVSIKQICLFFCLKVRVWSLVLVLLFLLHQVI